REWRWRGPTRHPSGRARKRNCNSGILPDARVAGAELNISFSSRKQVWVRGFGSTTCCYALLAKPFASILLPTHPLPRSLSEQPVGSIFQMHQELLADGWYVGIPCLSSSEL